MFAGLLRSGRSRGFKSAILAGMALVMMSAADARAPVSPSKKILAAAIRDAGAETLYEDLRQLLRDRLNAVSVRRIPLLTRELLADPLDADSRVVESGGMGALRTPAALVQTQLVRFRREFDLGRPGCGPDDRSGGAMATENPAARVAAMFAAADASASRAFLAVQAADRDEFLARLRGILSEATAGSGRDDDREARAFASVLLRLAGQVDFAALECSMRELAGMADEELLGTLRSWAEKARPIERPDWLDPRITGDLLWATATEHGVFLIGADGPNIYGAPVAAIIDVGGDDLYLGSGRGLDRTAGAAGVVIDLAGNDRYLATREGSAGGVVMGTALLFDGQGDDTYISTRVGQGAGILGHGALIDLAGDDLYAVDTFGQGAAMAGTGLAFDGAGADRWSAALLAQGSGGPAGLGVLLDREGDDVFRAGDLYPSSYGTPGIFQALAQGCGWGIRPDLAGGIGLLEDVAGDDIFLAGNFSQGTGYFLGTGLLLEHGGNDRYRGSRYSQGSAAHLAAGVLQDASGSDSYRGQIAANQGAGWDLAVGALFDARGNDEYVGADLSQGSAAQNGVGIFLDAAGSDHYSASGDRGGFSGPLSYGEGRGAGNIAVFIGQAPDETASGGAMGARTSLVNGQTARTMGN